MKTPLCEIMDRHNTDKCTPHNYTQVYYKLFKDMNPLHVFEMGIGHTNFDFTCNMGHIPNYRPGSSLRGWKEFFPNATIYGADIYEEAVRQAREQGIHTFYCNQLEPVEINALFKDLPMMDIIIDDGYHVFEANKILFESSIKHLAPDGIFVIEDIQAMFFDEFHRQVQEWKTMFPHLNFKLLQLQIEPFKIDNNNLLVISSRSLDNL